jgi:hypothetical protein
MESSCPYISCSTNRSNVPFFTNSDINLTLWGAPELTFNHDINIYTAISGQRTVNYEMQRILSETLCKSHLPIFIKTFLVILR